jgi:hypothetical protein
VEAKCRELKGLEQLGKAPDGGNGIGENKSAVFRVIKEKRVEIKILRL